MKTTTEMRESAGKTMHGIADTSKKAALAAVGAPVVVGKRIAGLTGRVTKSAGRAIETWIAEGEKVTEQLREAKMVEEIKERVDFEQLQGRVEKLREVSLDRVRARGYAFQEEILVFVSLLLKSQESIICSFNFCIEKWGLAERYGTHEENLCTGRI